MKNKPYSGYFITIEGGEGAGKSTLAQSLHSHLSKDHDLLLTREPGGTLLSEKIRELVLHSAQAPSARAELLLFLAARLEHVDQVILPALNQGKVVICERFHDSSVVYQGLARNLGVNWVEELCLLATHHLQPDTTFLLDIDPQNAFSRLETETLDRIEQEELSFHQVVRQGYLQLADHYPDRIILLDALLDKQELLASCLSYLETLLKKDDYVR